MTTAGVLTYSGYNTVPKNVYPMLHFCKVMWRGGSPSTRPTLAKHAMHLCNREAHIGGVCQCLCGSRVRYLIPARRVFKGRVRHDDEP